MIEQAAPVVAQVSDNVLLIVLGSIVTGVVVPLVGGLLWLLKRSVRKNDAATAIIIKLQQDSTRQLSDDTIRTLDETGPE